MAQNRRDALPVPARFHTFVGYIRVSTGKQAENGPSLESQQDRLLGFVHARGGELLRIYDDVGSAYETSYKRPGLGCAINHAKANSLPLLVPSVDRLARNVDVLPRLRGVDVISVEEGWVPPEHLKALVQAASQESGVRSAAAKEVHRKRKASGKKRSAPANLPVLQRRGIRGNKTRRDVLLEKLIRAYDAHPELDVLSHADRAKWFNEHGILNLKNLKTGLGEPWNRRSMKYYWDQVIEQVAIRKELDEDPTGFDPSGLPDHPLGASSAVPPVILVPGMSAGSGEDDVASNPAPSSHQETASRSVTSAEIDALQSIMKRRGLTKSQVMDELKAERLDASIWSSVARGWKVRPELLNKLERWLDANRAP